MATETDQLLKAYAENQSEEAFNALASRYLDLVYSTALRFVPGDTHRAQDIAQIVFLNLAQQAKSLPSTTLLGGWLHRVTCNTALKALRSEARRSNRERKAAEMTTLENTSSDYTELRAALDQVINDLPDQDRKAILLRFYEQLDLSSVGDALGISENAAQKRIARALERLEAMLVARKTVFASGALLTVLTAEAVSATPAAVLASVTNLTSLGIGTTQIATVTASAGKLKLAAALIVSVGLLAITILQHRELNALRSSLAANPPQALLVSQASSAPVPVSEPGSFPTAAPSAEVLRLRGEVGRLRRENGELTTLKERLSLALEASAARPLPGAPSDIVQPLFTRIIKVDPSTLTAEFQKYQPISTTNALREQLAMFLSTNGINLSPPSVVFFNDGKGEVVVHASTNDIDQLEKILFTQQLNAAPAESEPP
jgi:RNA polymerase sigma factor (sigma-70 family)